MLSLEEKLRLLSMVDILEPLPPGSDNELSVKIGRERAGRDHMLAVLRRTQFMRSEV